MFRVRSFTPAGSDIHLDPTFDSDRTNRVAAKFGPLVAPIFGPRRALGPLIRVFRVARSVAAAQRAVST